MNKKRGKRANGEGTFYQLEDKSWVHQITIGTKPDGRPDRKSFKGKTQSECIRRKNEYLDQQKRLKELEQEQEAKRQREAEEAARLGHPPEAETLFKDAFMPWLELYKAPPIKKPTTYGTYLDLYHTHYLPYFGEMKLCEITQDTIQTYYQGLQKNGARKDGRPGGLSAKTIRNHHMLLKDFFGYAKGKYKLEGNPTERTERPEVHTPPWRVLSPEEMVIFMQEVMRETQRVAILFDLFTGLRKGELLELEIPDLNLKTQSVRVHRDITRVRTDAINLEDPNIWVPYYNPDHKTQLIVQNMPKTNSSVRDMPLSDDLCELLLRHLFTLQHSSWPNPHNLIFPSTKGTYIDPKSFEIRLSAVSKRCEMKKVNPHALRHTFGTKLVNDNVPLTIVKDLMGHASVTTTQLYTHKDTEVQREAITSFTNCLSMKSLEDAPRLNGTKKRMKFSDVVLPHFA